MEEAILLKSECYKISVFQLSATRFTLSPDSDPDTLATNSKTATAKSDLYKM